MKKKGILLLVIFLFLMVALVGRFFPHELIGKIFLPQGNEHLGSLLLRSEEISNKEIILPALNCNWRIKFSDTNSYYTINENVVVDLRIRNLAGNDLAVWSINAGQEGSYFDILPPGAETLWYSGALNVLIGKTEYTGLTLELNSRGLNNEIKVDLLFEIHGELAGEGEKIELRAYYNDSI